MVHNGFGEYLAYRINSEGIKESVTQDEYKIIFEIIENIRSLKGDQFPENRHCYLKTKIQEKLGSEIQIAFIPRSLYELIYLQECVQEDLNNGNCGLSFAIGTEQLWYDIKVETQKQEYGIDDKIKTEERWSKNEAKIQEILKTHFWQHCKFSDTDYKINLALNDSDCRQEYIQMVAARLNKVALEKFNFQNENAEGFSFLEIEQVTKTCLDFFKDISLETSANHHKALSIEDNNYGYPRASMAKVFATDLSWPLRIKEKGHEQIVNKAIKLECSVEAINHLILYRGSKNSEDAVLINSYFFVNNCVIEKPLQHSLSFGSLLGGALYDRGACAFKFMRSPENDALAYVVPLNKLLEGKTPFTIPNVHPLITMMSWGEYFHGRTFVCENDPIGLIRGFGARSDTRAINVLPSFNKTDQTQEDLRRKFDKYKAKVHFLAHKEQ